MCKTTGVDVTIILALLARTRCVILKNLYTIKNCKLYQNFSLTECYGICTIHVIVIYIF